MTVELSPYIIQLKRENEKKRESERDEPYGLLEEGFFSRVSESH